MFDALYAKVEAAQEALSEACEAEIVRVLRLAYPEATEAYVEVVLDLNFTEHTLQLKVGDDTVEPDFDRLQDHIDDQTVEEWLCEVTEGFAAYYEPGSCTTIVLEEV